LFLYLVFLEGVGQWISKELLIIVQQVCGTKLVFISYALIQGLNSGLFFRMQGVSIYVIPVIPLVPQKLPKLDNQQGSPAATGGPFTQRLEVWMLYDCR
jgi:hypothetical protein